MGRPRIYKTNAERQKAYRERKKASVSPPKAHDDEFVARSMAFGDKVVERLFHPK